MFSHSKLPVLIVLLTLHGQGQTGKIIGGREAVPHSRPYMAFIEHMKNNETFYCNGCLLNENFVLTAAHCQGSNYKVFLGVHDTSILDNNKKVQYLTVEKAIPHPNYTPHANDLMLLKLTPKPVLNRNVKTIALASHDNGTLPKSCIVSGWGQTYPFGPISSKLMEINVTLTDDKKCAEHNLYCSKGNVRPSTGDSGGPLVCEDGSTYGVVSFLYNDPNDSPLTAYTKIPHYLSWINKMMKKTLSKN
ncbi:granzyme B(G,H)-like [Fundulus heteroclitus]|uniref:granzyme B(G,H)-like n=1 Tax=Fundulus heteroclitus TaxID=8078 RepID=UPI00165C8FE6|nr:granzyme B(G,H)-like [Fundulus heteroclitus]